jgi:predicted transcriptional regulator
LRELAMEACLIRMKDTLAAEIAALALSSDEARRLARFELGRYAAHALMMPYGRFQPAAVRERYDVDELRSRFGVSFEQAANRLTMLQRPGASGVAFFMLEVDSAGHRIRRAGAQGFPQSRFGGGCPKLSVHAAFAQPGQVLVESVAMADGAEFLTVSRTVEGPQGAFNERPRRTALLLGCDIGFKDEIAYAAALPAGQPTPGKSAPASATATAIGPACRLCERTGCLARAEPPVTRPLGLDEMVTGLSAFDFQ